MCEASQYMLEGRVGCEVLKCLMSTTLEEGGEAGTTSTPKILGIRQAHVIFIFIKFFS